MSNGTPNGNPWPSEPPGAGEWTGNRFDPEQWKGCDPAPLSYAGVTTEKPTQATIQIDGQNATDRTATLLRGILPRPPNEDEKTYVRERAPQLAGHCWWVRDDVGKKNYNSVGYCAARESGELKWLEIPSLEMDTYFENMGFKSDQIPSMGLPANTEIVYFSGNHMARKSGYRIGEEYLWESKLVDGPRILHHLSDLEGGTFGKVSHIYQPDPWNKPACKLGELKYSGPATYANKPVNMDHNVGNLKGEEQYDVIMRGIAPRRPVKEECYSELITEFAHPRLFASCWWIVDDMSREVYNCHGWVVGVDSKVFQYLPAAFPETQVRELSYQPIEVPTDNSIPANAVIAEFEVEHSARRSFYQNSQGWLWESKVQHWYRIIHALHDIEGGIYGKVKRYWGKTS